MTANEYLTKVLDEQKLSTKGDELKELRKHRADVDALLAKELSDPKPVIRYGGSKAKGTMIRESYDLDITCYLPHDTELTLTEIYTAVQEALESNYFVEKKTSALRLKEKDPQLHRADFHIDVVPGRFVDEAKGDAFIHQESAEKSRLKTNLDTHVSHIRDSGVVDAIRLTKLWKARNYLDAAKTFVLELLVVELLKRKKSSGLSTQLEHVWTELRDNTENLAVEDPANPNGNDLNPLLDTARSALQTTASTTLFQIENTGWTAVFGDLADDSNGDNRAAALKAATVHVKTPTRPWSGGR